MSDKSCDCTNITLGNTGKPDCSSIADVAAYLILDMAKDSSGAPKSRLVADLLSFNTLEPLLNAASPLDRLYPLGKFENVEHNREDDVFWTANSGKQAFVREGFKNFSGMLINAPRELVGLLNANNCKNFGFHIIDDSNQLITKKGDFGSYCKPILIDNDTFRAKYVEATNDAPAMIMLSFQWKSTEKDQNIKVATGLNYTGEDLYGLLNAQIKTTFPSIDFVVADCTLIDYGYQVEGLTISDFVVTEISPTPGTINLLSAEETSPGVYELYFDPQQTSGDVIKVEVVKDRYDFSATPEGINVETLP